MSCDRLSLATEAVGGPRGLRKNAVRRKRPSHRDDERMGGRTQPACLPVSGGIPPCSCSPPKWWIQAGCKVHAARLDAGGILLENARWPTIGATNLAGPHAAKQIVRCPGTPIILAQDLLGQDPPAILHTGWLEDASKGTIPIHRETFGNEKTISSFRNLPEGRGEAGAVFGGKVFGKTR